MINKVILVGDVWKDPEERTTKKEGVSIAILSVVTKEFYKNPSGEYTEKKEWHTIISFGETAKYLLEKIKKGDVVYVEGQIQTREFVDTETNKKNYIREININRNGVVKKIFNRKRESSSIDLIDSMGDENRDKHDTDADRAKQNDNDDNEDDDLLF